MGSSARLASVALFVSLASPCLADEETILTTRMQELRALFAEAPGGFEEIFHESFLAQVPPARLKALLQQLVRDHGSCVGAVLLERKDERTAVFELTFEKGSTMQSTLTVESKPPFRVTGWFLGPPAPAVKSLSEIAERMKELPGSVSFAVARLGEDEPVLLAEVDPDLPLAIGSSFKLYVLGAIARGVEKGDLRWDQVVRLREEALGFPSGILHEWPAGSPVTVQTLASLMISISDNTATDHLLLLAQRRSVEAMLEPMGNRHAARNVPFPSTLELFKIKCDREGKRAPAYLALDAEGRRAYLERELPSLGREEADLGLLTGPLHIDTLEWFASARDLVGAMDWLRKAGARKGLEPVLEVLAINPGIQLPASNYEYVGFKGGSEPGVLNGTLLLRSPSGAWFAVSAGWNDPARELDKTKFFGLVQKACRLLAP